MEDNLNIVNLVEEPKKQKYKGVIGTLKGIFADMNHPTRNGIDSILKLAGNKH